MKWIKNKKAARKTLKEQKLIKLKYNPKTAIQSLTQQEDRSWEKPKISLYSTF